MYDINMSEKFRLQLLSHDTVFSTREEAIEYIEDNFKYEALYAEPALFYYGNSKNPYFILAFGVGDKKITYIDSGDIAESIAAIKETDEERDKELALINEKLLGIIESTGLTYDENKKKNQITYEPDSKDKIIGDADSIAEAVSLLSKFIQESISTGEVKGDTTKSIEVKVTKDESDNTIVSGNVLVSEAGGNDDVDFNNNMIGIKKDGLYAAANLDYDENTHKLTFTASGVKNGVYKNDATRKVIDLGEHSKYTAENEGHNIKVTITPKDANNATISADVKLSEDEDNILRTKDGKLFVEGRAKNIKFGGTTVAKKLNEVTDNIDTIERKLEKIADATDISGAETDTSIVTATKNAAGGYTISNVVRLSSDESIVTSNGGLSANIDVNIDSTTNTLSVKVGKNTKVLSLPGVDIISDMYYDSANKVLVIKTSDGKTITIPVGDMLTTWVVENKQDSPVVLSKTTGASGEPDKLSADIKLVNTNNLLGKNESGHLYVSESNIDNKIGVETARAIEIEKDLKKEIEDSIDNVTEKLDNLTSKVDKNTTDIVAEETRAKAEEAVLKNSVENNANAIEAEVTRAKEEEGDLSERITLNRTDINTVKESVQENKAGIAANATAIEKEIADRKEADATITTNLAETAGKVAAEITRATNKEEELAADIASANLAVINEVSRAQGAENTLTERISANTTQINQINNGLSEKLQHVLDDAKEYTDAFKDIANVNFSSINTTIEEKDNASKDRDAVNLATAKAYTDSEIEKISSSSSTNIEEAKDQAIGTAKADATEKVATALETAKAYTDAETARAKVAEEANANAIVDLKAKDIEIETALGKKIESVVIEKASTEDDLNYNVYVDGAKVGEINIPKDQFLKDVTYNAASKELTFVFDTKDGTKVTTINIADLIDTYLAGDGLKLEDNKFSVKKDGASEKYLEVTADGIKIVGIDEALVAKANVDDVYTKDEADAKFITEHQDISALATKAEVEAVASDVDSLEDRVKGEENKLDVINGNEATDGSIKKAQKDAEAYAKEYTDAETERAKAAEKESSDAIAIINGNSAQEGSIKKALADAKEYANERTENVNTTLTEKINTLSDTVATKANSADVYTKAEIEAKGFLTSASTVGFATKAEVEEESSRAKAAEQGNATAIAAVKETADTNKTDIAELKVEATRLNLTAVETNSIKIDLDKEADGSKISAELKIDTSVSNILKIGGNGVYADVEMTYDKATNTITFNNGIATQSFTLSEHSLVVGGIYDSAAKAIVLTVQTAEGTNNISIPVGDLIHSLKVENTTENPVKLALTQDASGIDVLTAKLDISTKDDNGLLRDNGTLYVSNNADAMTGYWNGEKKSLQLIINNLKEQTDKVETMDTDVTQLKSDMTQAQYDVMSLKADNTVIKASIETQNEKIATMDGKVDAIVTQYETISEKVSTMESKFTILENEVNTYSDRIVSMENKVATMQSNLAGALADIEEIKNEIDGAGSGSSIAERLAKLENIVNNLIDFSDLDSDGNPDGY